jgi:hypothetical protein
MLLILLVFIDSAAMPPTRLLPVLALLAVSAACGSDTSTPSAQGTDGGSEDGTGAADANDSDPPTGGGTTADSTADDSSGDAPAVDVPARGARISLVEANSGVAVPIARDGEWVGGSGRNAPLPKGRDTAFRIYVDIDEDVWVTRDLEARVTITQPDARESVYTEQGEISTDSSTTSLQSNILVGVVAADMQPGAKFQVELYEAGGDYAGLPEAAEPPRALQDGADQIGIEGSEQNMKVLFVPIDYSFGGCSTLPGMDEDEFQSYADAMFQQNPLETLEIEVGAPLAVDDLDLTDGNDFFALLNRIVQYRAGLGLEPNVYVYGLFDNCGVCIGEGGGCLLGVAPGTPGASQGEASQRAAIGVRYLSDSEVGIETFVHEIGHTQGRQHIACPGAAAAGPDPSYPHSDGGIGVWGFGVRDFGVRSASNYKDYMSYCNPTWVSDWQWSATFARIKSLTEWDLLDAVEPPSTTVLVGTMNTETGESHWWTEPGLVEDGDTVGSASTLALLGGSEELHVAKADVDPWSEGPWVTVRANLPADATTAAAAAFELRTPTRSVRFERDAVRFELAGSLRAR